MSGAVQMREVRDTSLYRTEEGKLLNLSACRQGMGQRQSLRIEAARPAAGRMRCAKRLLPHNYHLMYFDWD